MIEESVKDLSARICISSFKILRCLEDNRIYLATSMGSGSVCTIKVSSRDQLHKSLFNLRREYVIHASLNHPNIVEVGEAFEDHDRFGFSMEYLGGGDLRSLIGRISRSQIPILFYHIASGLAHVHSKGFVHADIKPENILLSSAGIPKICDFGVARDLKTKRVDSIKSIVGTTTYLSPEYILWGDIGTYSDIYSLGIMMLELYLGEIPGNFLSLLEMMKARDDFYKHPNFDRIPVEIRDLIIKCLAKDPKSRIQDGSQFLDVISQFVNKVNSEKLYSTQKRRLRISSDENYVNKKAA
jgi:serine/threonine protein kinase